MAKAKYTQGKDGFFQAKVWDGTYNELGRKHRITLRSKKSSRDLENKVNEFNRNVEMRKYVRKSDITFTEYAEMWKDVYKAQKSANTRAMYENIIEKHFSVLEATRLQDVNRIHLQTILNHADGKTRTQQQIQLTFKQVIKSAVTDKLFPENVAAEIFSSVESIRYVPEERRPLETYEKEAVFKANYKYERDKVYTYIIYGCGLRREEALALTVFDFNFKRNVLNINKAYEYTKDVPTLKAPKSKNGYREVPIPTKILPDVKNFVDAAKKRGRANIFAMRNGKPITKSSYDKMFARIVAAMQGVTKQEIHGLTGHMFRHNYCTSLCYQIPKVSIKKIAQLMGDTEKMVLDVYNHVVLEKEDAAGAVDDAINF